MITFILVTATIGYLLKVIFDIKSKLDVISYKMELLRDDHANLKIDENIECVLDDDEYEYVLLSRLNAVNDKIRLISSKIEELDDELVSEFNVNIHNTSFEESREGG